MITAMDIYSLPALAQLEAESIYILREVAAEFARPAMLCSEEKDSAVLERLAAKAFAPEEIPFARVRADSPTDAFDALIDPAHGKEKPREFWKLYNTRVQPGKRVRVLPLADWTAVDIERYLAAGERT